MCDLWHKKSLSNLLEKAFLDTSYASLNLCQKIFIVLYFKSLLTNKRFYANIVSKIFTHTSTKPARPTHPNKLLHSQSKAGFHQRVQQGN